MSELINNTVLMALYNNNGKDEIPLPDGLIALRIKDLSKYIQRNYGFVPGTETNWIIKSDDEEVHIAVGINTKSQEVSYALLVLQILD